MKRIINGISLFAVIVLSLVFAYPSNTYALTEQTSFVNISNTQSLEVGSLSFTNISFKDFSSISTQAFGLAGIVRNSSNNEINYTSTAYYYDSNYNLIAQGYNSATAISGSNSFSQMSNLSILNGHSVDEIYYYRLSIETIDNENSSLTNTTSLTPSKNYQYSSYDYVIDKYDINIIVNENNTFDITETITAYFNVSKHGIFRTIPLKNTITRLDGTTSTNRTQVTNVSVDNEYTTSRENGNYKLKIGSENRTLTGEQTYVLKYTYNLGKDPVKDYDELYYNIIGNEWDTVIGNVTFSITMPKEFDSSKLGFSSGVKGSTANSKVKYNVSGNKITGSYNSILGVGESLTVRCELPEGYFVGAGLSINIIDYIMFLIPVLLLIISILLWYKFGRDDQVIETVEFYPPEGLNSLDVGLLYKGKAEKIFGLILGLGFGGMPWLFMVLPTLTQDITYLIGYIIGIICVIGMIICLVYLPKRTKYGNEMLGKLKGFKNFLETAEKEKLEAMVLDNPNYFYDILPFTYVLGVSDKWIKKFETISLQAPTWYNSPNAFDVSTFGTFVNSTMVSAQSAMSSSPSSDSGGGSSGGSSGGGSSGGGSGGGGGGSW